MGGCEDRDCKDLKPGTASLCQGDIMLCEDCNIRRFGPLPIVRPKIILPSKKLHSKGQKENRPKFASNSNCELTIEQATAAVLSEHIGSLNRMSAQCLRTYNANDELTTIRANLASILPQGTDPTTIANHSLSICAKLSAKCLGRRAELDQPQMTVSQSILLDTPLRPAAPTSPRITTPLPTISVNARRITCVQDCNFNHLETKCKALSCSLCNEQYHKACIGLKPTAKPTIWLCSTCKEIPSLVKGLSSLVQDQQKEIKALQEENRTLAELVGEQKAMLDSMHADSVKDDHELNQGLVEPAIDNETAEVSANRYIIVGDSMIKNIEERGLTDTDVSCLPGARVKDVHEELKQVDVSTLEGVIIHAGTNDCVSNTKLKDGKKDFENLVKELKGRAPVADIVVSTVCPRLDANAQRATEMNTHIRSTARKYNCKVVDNEKNFRSRDYINPRDKLHLNKAGTRYLLMNISASCKRKIVKGRHQELSARPGKPNRDTVSHRHQGRRDDNHGHGRDANTKRCLFCGEKNHVKKNCRHGKSISCFNGGEAGHKSHMGLCK